MIFLPWIMIWYPSVGSVGGAGREHRASPVMDHRVRHVDRLPAQAAQREAGERLSIAAYLARNWIEAHATVSPSAPVGIIT